MANFNLFDFYNDGNGGYSIYRNEKSPSAAMSEEQLAKALGGVAMHGDSADYVNMGNLRFGSNGHGGDAGKLPWHPTFSNQSMFATNLEGPRQGAMPLMEGGRWTSGIGEPDTYYPTQEQMQRKGYADELNRYFNNEYGRGIDKIVTPPPYDSRMFNIRSK